MTIQANIIAHSVGPYSKPIVTFDTYYPRFIHAEMMTHRVFSRNASSSRAIPVKRMIEAILADPAMPVHWGKNQSGMQARTELEGEAKEVALDTWLAAMALAVKEAQRLHDLGAHKQIVNRILEPFMHIRAVYTATELNNFFALRCHADAQPEIKHLADLMREALKFSVPQKLKIGEWHLPYIIPQDWVEAEEYCKRFADKPTYQEKVEHFLRPRSVARLARTSYDNHDGSARSFEKDIQLHNDLLVATPLHASPAEHVCTPDSQEPYLDGTPRVEWNYPHQHGNTPGWRQYRKMLENEYVPG